MNANDVRQLLKAECKAMGGEKHFAKKAAVSVQLIYAIETGRREPRGKVLDALGLEIKRIYCRRGGAGD